MAPLSRDYERDHLAAIFSIRPEIVVRREDDRSIALFRHPDETGIRKAHGHVTVAPDKTQRFREFIVQREARDNDSPFEHAA